MSLTRDQILSMDDLPRVEVKIPEWGGSVFVRTISAGERDRFEESIQGSTSDIRARLAVLAVSDENGVPLFTDKDLNLLTLRSARALNRIFIVATQLSGITKDDVEELEKNSQAVPCDGTSSDLPLCLDGPSETLNGQ